MDFSSNLIAILISFGKAQLIALAIIIGSFIIEKLTPIKLFIYHYTWKKSLQNAKILSDRDSGSYVILMLIVLFYDNYHDKFVLTIFSGIFIFIVFIALARIFYIIHKKYQAVDPEKEDDDFS